MKRNKINEHISADAILVSDLHLTDSTPISRIDDYQKSQQKMLEFLQQLSSQNNNCPILCAGDVFDHWKASPWLMQWTYQYLPRPFICIPGQHDLPGHSLQEFNKSALFLLNVVSNPNEFKILNKELVEKENLCILGLPFGELQKFDFGLLDFIPYTNKRKILILHELTWPESQPSWTKDNSKIYTSHKLLTEYGKYFDLIVTGDNHQTFTKQLENSLLVNPGSMMQMSADQEDHIPTCFLYYAKSNKVKAIPFPVEQGVLDRKHIDIKKEKDTRIMAYIERMNKDWDIGISFRKNLEMFFMENNVTRSVKEIIWQTMGEKI